MNFECPNCKKSGQIEDFKVPEAGVSAICPQCKCKFLVKRDKPNNFKFEPIDESSKQAFNYVTRKQIFRRLLVRTLTTIYLYLRDLIVMVKQL